ncbi:MAG: hypothetical protein RLZZ219_1102 [Cyanobacteriota bacterium]
MTQGADPSPDATPASSPYERLGIAPTASFDAVQEARQQRLAEVGDDPQARARVEAAYDAVLMDRLKERQQGKVSTAALTASEREAARPAPASPPSLPSLPRLAALPRPSLPAAPRLQLPTLALAEGRRRWLPLLAGAVLLGMLLLAPTAADLVLALATLLTAFALQNRNGRFLAAVGWSFALLTVGLLLGGVLLSVLDPALPLGLPLTPQQAQSLPALVLLALGALLIG